MERIYTDSLALNRIGKVAPQTLNKPDFQTKKVNFSKKSLMLFVFFIGLFELNINAQVPGDYRSKTANMNWNVASSWQVYNSSSSWVTASSYPGQNSTPGTVYIDNDVPVILNISPANPIGNLVVGTSGGNKGTTLTFTGGNLIVTGNVTIPAPNPSQTNKIDITTYSLTVGGNINIAGDYNGSNINIGLLASSSGTINCAGDLSFTGTAANARLTFTGAGTLNLGGSFRNGGTFTASTSTANFNGSSTAQTIPNGTYNFYNININNTSTGGATFGGIATATNVAGNLSVQSGTLNNGGFAITLASGKNFSVSNGATFNLTGTSSMVSVSGVGTKTFGATSTTNYSGSTQTVSAETYGHLTLSGSNTKTTAGSIAVSGILTIASSVTFDMGKFKLTGSSLTTSGAGTLKTQYVSTSSDFAIPAGRTWTFPVEYSALEAQTISDGNYYNLTLSGIGVKSFTATTTTISQNFTLGGTVTATAAAALSIGGNVTIGINTAFVAGNYNHIVGGNWSNTGTFTSSNGTITFASTLAGKTISGSLTGTSKFNKLIFDGVGGGWTLNDNTEVGGSSTALDIKNGKLTVSAGKYLDVRNGSTTLGSAECLLLKSNNSGTTGGTTASFIDNGTIDGSGTAKIERYLDKYISVSDLKFHFISSPVVGQPISTEFINLPTLGTDFYRWDESQNYWISYRDLNVPSTLNTGFGETQFASGKGYLVAYPNDVTKNFIGKPYTNTDGLKINYYNHPLAGKGWHLLGNPFPSAINWDLVNSDGMDDALYFYDNTMAQYRYYHKLTGDLSTTLSTSNGYIPSMQGFMMHASATGGSVTIANKDRVHQNMTLFYKSATLTENVLNLKVEGNNVSDAARVCFYDQATENFDGEFDAYKLFSYNASVPNLYSVTPDQTKVAINTLPLDQMYGTVPLGFTPGEAGTYTITADGISNFPSTVYIKLEDKKTNSIQKLNDNPVYSFTATPGDDSTRFVLHFQDATAINNPEATNNFTMHVDNGVITINQLESISGKVKVSDMLGRTVAMENLVADTPLRINLNSVPGVYVVTVYTKSKTYSRKVVIR